jgi:hypothetical protein
MVRLSTAFAFLAILAAEAAAQVQAPPYDRSLPMIYDNDGTIESGFTDPFVLAMSSAGVINLRGIVATCSYAEETRIPPFSPVPDDKNFCIIERKELFEKARRSGFKNIPPLYAGPTLSFQSRKPGSGRIEDTAPFNSPGGRFIRDQARLATATRPLVIFMGGQCTAVVDAYLLDPTIADKMVLAWVTGHKRSDGQMDSNEYNAGVDPWGTYIAHARLRVVAYCFPNDGTDAYALTPKSRLPELPDTELRTTMMENRWPRGNGTFSEPSVDWDAMPAFWLFRPEYIVRTKRVSFSHWYPSPWTPVVQLPFYREDPAGRTLVVWDGSRTVATDEWWRRMKDPAAWGPQIGQIAMNGTPWAVPGTIEAENFDHGGTGRAYSDTTNNWTTEAWFNPIRFLEHVDIRASSTATGGHKIGMTAAGEWIEYTVNVASAGTYTLEARVASAGAGGSFRVEAKGVNVTGTLWVPNTGGWDAWQNVTKTGVLLSAGVQVLRLYMESNGATGGVADFDHLRLTLSGSTPPPPSGFPMTLEAESMPTKTAGGWAIPGGWQLWGTGDYVEQTVNFPTAGSYRFDITAAGMFAGGAWSIMQLRIDQVGVASFTVDSTTWKTFSATVNVGAGAHRVAVAFMNDYYVAPSTHRDLNVDKIVISVASAPPPPPPPPPGGSGTGLKGDYFDNSDFTAFKLTRTDPTVDFNWESGSPDASIGPDTWSARWTGQVEAPATGSYTFTTVSDDGVRLWLNGVLLVNNWTQHAPTENSGSISLTGGLKYALVLEYYEGGGPGMIRLLWSGPGIAKATVPQSRLYPAGGSPPPQPTGLVARWRMDETGGTVAADASGNGNTGTLRNGAGWTPGRIGGALRLDGVDDHVSVNDSASLSSPASQITVACWAYRTGNKGAWQTLATRQRGVQWDDQWFLGFNNNQYWFGVHTTAGYPQAAGPLAPLNQWVHVAGTYDGATVRLFVNGVQVATAAGSGTILREAKPLLIGAGMNDATGIAGDGFLGWMDDVRLYNRALSASEIQALYAGTAP